MTMIWRETEDGLTPAPGGMLVNGLVRRRSWRSEVIDDRCFELSVYLGTDAFNGTVCFWDCTVLQAGVAQERMTSGTRYYNGDLPRDLPEDVIAIVRPSEVMRYALWGELLAPSRWLLPMGMGDDDDDGGVA